MPPPWTAPMHDTKVIRPSSLATILAALRHWQQHPELGDDPRFSDFFGIDANYAPLDADEIDELCEELNQ